VSTAKGWLSLADNKLTRMEEILTRLRVLAEQTSTGNVSADNRSQVSYEARQLYEELVVLSNTQYEDKYIFAGHKTDTKAYEQALWVTDNDGSRRARTSPSPGPRRAPGSCAAPRRAPWAPTP
jgi:flagellar hook-associated protein 3 FlgL